MTPISIDRLAEAYYAKWDPEYYDDDEEEDEDLGDCDPYDIATEDRLIEEDEDEDQ